MWLKEKELAVKVYKAELRPRCPHTRWEWMHMPMTSRREAEDGQTPAVPWPGESSWDEKF